MFFWCQNLDGTFVSNTLRNKAWRLILNLPSRRMCNLRPNEKLAIPKEFIRGGLTIVQRFYRGSIQKKSYQCHNVVMQFEAFILLPFCLAFCKLPCPRSHTILSRFRALVWNRFIFKNPFLICFKFHHHFQSFIFPTFLTQPTFPYLSLILK